MPDQITKPKKPADLSAVALAKAEAKPLSLSERAAQAAKQQAVDQKRAATEAAMPKFIELLERLGAKPDSVPKELRATVDNLVIEFDPQYAAARVISVFEGKEYRSHVFSDLPGLNRILTTPTELHPGYVPSAKP